MLTRRIKIYQLRPCKNVRKGNALNILQSLFLGYFCNRALSYLPNINIHNKIKSSMFLSQIDHNYGFNKFM